MKAIPIIAAVLAVLNLLSFCLMAYDKRLAKTGRRRVPEKVVGMLSQAFMVLLLCLMAFLIYRDSARMWRIHRHTAKISQARQGGKADSPAADADKGADADKEPYKGAEGR